MTAWYVSSDLCSLMSLQMSKSSSKYTQIIQLFIEYANTKPWMGPSSHIDYVYRAQLIEGTKAKQETATYDPYPAKRTTLNRHGIEIQIIQTGKLGAVDMSTLLINLTTSLTLLALSTTLVDYTALYLLNKKEVGLRNYDHDRMMKSANLATASIFVCTTV